MKRTNCSSCGSPDLDQFLDLGLSPVADAYTSAATDVPSAYPLQVAVCGKCHLVQLLEVLAGDELFGTGYSFYSSASAPLSAYHRAYADNVLSRHLNLVRKGVVEIGSNDGDLLRHFAEFPHLGVDPSTGPTAAAKERGCNVRTQPFSLALAKELRAEAKEPAGVVIANHVLAHVEDVSDCLAGISHLLKDGVAIIEVQYLPDLLVNNAFDLVYHEHRNFFSLTSLDFAASRHGLYVVDADLTDRQGGSLRATLAKTKGAMVRPSKVSSILAAEQWLNDFSAYAGMQGRAERIRTRLVEMVGSFDRVAVYGAPAKLTTLLNFCGLDSTKLRWCEDSTPAKQGRFIPGTGIQIFPPTPSPISPMADLPRPDAYLLGAHNYASTIIANNPGNRWIAPIPAPVIL